MLIIDRNKDYYDYLSHVYGVDKKVVFDRRGSVNLTNDDLISMVDTLSYPRVKDLTGNILLEVGYKQYLFELSNFSGGEEFAIPTSFDIELKRVFTDYKHYFPTPISLRGCKLKYIWRWKKFDYNQPFTELLRVSTNKHTIQENPILKNTKITSIISEQEIWEELQNYISSLNNDKDVSLPMTDKERAETHGFDKHSFRNPIK